MKTYVALFRGINVGGRHTLPMKELVEILGDLGARKVRTYIQSGNAVFQCGGRHLARLSGAIPGEIRKRYGFEPWVLVVEDKTMERAMAANPFPDAESEPTTLHLGFLASAPPDPDLKSLDRLRGKTERFSLTDDVFYLHAPEGVGRSRLLAKAEQLLGVTMTARNWRTVCRIRELAGMLANNDKKSSSDQ